MSVSPTATKEIIIYPGTVIHGRHQSRWKVLQKARVKPRFYWRWIHFFLPKWKPRIKVFGQLV